MTEALSIIEQVDKHPLLDKIISELTYNQLFYKRFNQPRLEISKSDLRKTIWLTSILSESHEDSHRNKAQLISSLIFLNNSNDPNIARAIYVLFSRVGNLTGTKLLKSSEETYGEDLLAPNRSVKYFDPALTMALEIERFESSIVSDEEIITATRFQKSLWDQLKYSDNVMISAPTSSGKSFIIKKFLNSKMSELNSYTAIYIVPSRALINQVSEDLRNEVFLENVSIKTVFIQDELEEKSREIFILTPERCLRLLKMRWLREFDVDFIFIDEIQNVEDTDSRGPLFEFVFKELATLFPNAKVVAAGPNIEDSSKLFDHVFGHLGISVETTVSPVFQIKTTIKPLLGKRLKVSVSSVDDKPQSHVIETEVDFFGKFQKNMGDGIKELINLCSYRGEQNIIYCPKGNLATTWAKRFADTQPDQNVLNPVLQELIDFVAEEIHPMYQLIPCLLKQTAYHHGNLPEIIRKEIEDCFLDGSIRYLFCTTTLLQGVNLPANNLFIPIAQKRNIDLTPFDFGNLIGRAGRIKDSLYGTIYCIERSDQEWSTELYQKSIKKIVRTAGEVALQSPTELLNEISRSIDEFSHKHNRNTAIFFLQKFLKDPSELHDYLVKKELNSTDIEKIEEQLVNSTAVISMPNDMFRLNPTIDPLLQNVLYETLEKEGIENWMITPMSENKNFRAFMTEDTKNELPYTEWSFYLQLLEIITRLNEIFQMTGEAYWKYGIPMSVKQITLNAFNWLQNKSIHDIIIDDLKFYENHETEEKRIDLTNAIEVNERISYIIKINAVVITHILVKYIKLLNDLIEPRLTDELKERYKFSLALPTMLELGTNEPVVITLISRGVSRSIALKVFEVFKNVPNYADQDIFVWLKSQDNLNLKPIYNRYLSRMRLLKPKVDH